VRNSLQSMAIMTSLQPMQETWEDNIIMLRTITATKFIRVVTAVVYTITSEKIWNANVFGMAFKVVRQASWWSTWQEHNMTQIVVSIALVYYRDVIWLGKHQQNIAMHNIQTGNVASKPFSTSFKNFPEKSMSSSSKSFYIPNKRYY
jgi:hypothetical protein